MSNELEIIERLARIETGLAGIRDDVAELHQGVFGHSGAPGLYTRLDRLEQVERRRAWTIRALVTAFLGLVVSVAAAIGIR